MWVTFKCTFQVEEDIIHQPLLVSENYINDYPFMWHQNIGSVFFSFCHKARIWQRDGQLDVQTDRIFSGYVPGFNAYCSSKQDSKAAGQNLIKNITQTTGQPAWLKIKEMTNKPAWMTLEKAFIFEPAKPGFHTKQHMHIASRFNVTMC